ncbi:hypothetical protein IGI04_015096 [Brassica rapa subsp. trilocularis]|uniref:Uncharacterized protein n=2 Tax=Brassica TaxID=3705 RepID=A0ABQ8EEK2_BRANA|nr:hypothetical protein IGI04_023790 [Brassica rapa subsp. trilocularis]KAG5400489.1 hypothetical protein IGI04_015096 [Brassica rapa subsp. trilocularis]KAH0917654.1 hypothetical protein HID58_025314 [Brassica napus]KAH0922825.1 hypothetical protein HID58_022843 [Brassica napus]KAH0940112.1 hypothetical protein HID58_007573 [Brassica napus]
MSLRKCLEKLKPFIVAYEGGDRGSRRMGANIEVIGEVMVEAPLLKEIVDHDSVPDRVTAKKQNEELDRIATTVPKVHLML